MRLDRNRQKKYLILHTLSTVLLWAHILLDVLYPNHWIFT